VEVPLIIVLLKVLSLKVASPSTTPKNSSEPTDSIDTPLPPLYNSAASFSVITLDQILNSSIFPLNK